MTTDALDTSHRWDGLAERLTLLRASAGDPSYADIARRVFETRLAAGRHEAAARVARSTVYDSFRTGRSRVNLELVREIALTLGATDADVEAWIGECRSAADTTPAPPVEPVEPDPDSSPSRRQVGVLMLGCLALNLLGREFVDFFDFPIYLDMTGTAIAAIALGPWRGASVGVATNVIGIVGSGLISLPFALVNVVGALLWGYGVRRWRMGATLLRFFLLNLVTALACSLVAVPIIVLFRGEELRPGHDVITQLVQESIDTFVVAVGFSNVLTSSADKLLSGFFAMVVISALPAVLRRGSHLVLVTPPPLPGSPA